MNMRDQVSFLEVFLEHQDGLRMFIATLIRNRQDRDDVFQEVALVLWGKFDQYDPSRPFDAWARGIAANKMLQRRDKQGRLPTPFPPESVEAILNAFDRQDDRASPESESLEICIGKLPDRSRKMLDLRYRESLGAKEIAQRVGVSTASAFKTLARLRSALLECIERQLNKPHEASR